MQVVSLLDENSAVCCSCLPLTSISSARLCSICSLFPADTSVSTLISQGEALLTPVSKGHQHSVIATVASSSDPVSTRFIDTPHGSLFSSGWATTAGAGLCQLSLPSLYPPWVKGRVWKTVSPQHTLFRTCVVHTACDRALSSATVLALSPLILSSPLPPSPSVCVSDLFNLKFSAKQLVRESKKCEQSAAANKLKCKKAMEVNNMEGARIYAETAIRDKNQSLNYLRLSSRVDAVAQRVNTAVKMKSLTKDMSGIVSAMDSVMRTMNVEKISAVMDKFEKQFEDLDLATGVMEQSMQQSSSLTMPEQQVEGLMQQVADEHGLEFSAGLPGVGAGVGEKVAGRVEKKEDVLLGAGGGGAGAAGAKKKGAGDDDDHKGGGDGGMGGGGDFGGGSSGGGGGFGGGSGGGASSSRSAREEEESLEERLRRLQAGS